MRKTWQHGQAAIKLSNPLFSERILDRHETFVDDRSTKNYLWLKNLSNCGTIAYMLYDYYT